MAGVIFTANDEGLALVEKAAVEIAGKTVVNPILTVKTTDPIVFDLAANGNEGIAGFIGAEDVPGAEGAIRFELGDESSKGRAGAGSMEGPCG